MFRNCFCFCSAGVSNNLAIFINLKVEFEILIFFIFLKFCDDYIFILL